MVLFLGDPKENGIYFGLYKKEDYFRNIIFFISATLKKTATFLGHSKKNVFERYEKTVMT